MRKNIGVILAGGLGSRFGLLKQFLTLGNKTVLEYSVHSFASCDVIDEIVIVASPEHYEKIQGLFQQLSKPLILAPAGKERYFSTLSALNLYDKLDHINMLIHDAARPLVSPTLIKKCVDALQSAEAVSVAMPCNDTIFEASNNIISAIPPRSHLWRAQTPQGFRGEILRLAFDKALQDVNLQSTDDCGIVHRYLPEIPITLVDGEECNMKITYADDIKLLEHLLKLSNTKEKT
ncbi:MAG: IspD/TarI family cytidylyltransferase [Brevinema sp.]